MDDLFARFIEEEFEWIFSDSDSVANVTAGFDEAINEDEFYEHFEEFKNQVVNKVANDEWIIQQIHERIDDMLIDSLKDYLNNK